VATKNVVTKTYGNQKCGDESSDQNLWWPKTWQQKPMVTENLVTKSCGDQNFGN
jgi:hypothetical protein